MVTRGYFGIGMYNFQHECNLGSLFRAAHAFGAAFVFTIGRSYRRQSSDVSNATHHVPYLRYESMNDFIDGLPSGCIPINVELVENSHRLPAFSHPSRAAYILGRETGGIPSCLLTKYPCVQIPGQLCLNVANAGAIVMYDRVAKATK